MAESLDPNDLATLEELAISNMWETSALVEIVSPSDTPTTRPVKSAARAAERSQRAEAKSRRTLQCFTNVRDYSLRER